jgi:hypothetical protein
MCPLDVGFFNSRQSRLDGKIEPSIYMDIFGEKRELVG